MTSGPLYHQFGSAAQESYLHVQCDLAANTGVHIAEGIIKQLLAGRWPPRFAQLSIEMGLTIWKFCCLT
ncbi:MAG: hypothetical protein DRI46_04455 [Chloroflexi bacterium]|nr:MAG: hypothetical protein DRI46_04455 [Chloroflexota bacterium]